MVRNKINMMRILIFILFRPEFIFLSITTAAFLFDYIVNDSTSNVKGIIVVYAVVGSWVFFLIGSYFFYKIKSASLAKDGTLENDRDENHE